jgi:hypothetical protein
MEEEKKQSVLVSAGLQTWVIKREFKNCCASPHPRFGKSLSAWRFFDVREERKVG